MSNDSGCLFDVYTIGWGRIRVKHENLSTVDMNFTEFYSQDHNFGRVTTKFSFYLRHHQFSTFSHFPPLTVQTTPYLWAYIVGMPWKQKPETDQFVKSMLGLGIEQKLIVERAHCSIWQVQRIKHNLLQYGTVCKPKKPEQGRKRVLTNLQEDVSNL